MILLLKVFGIFFVLFRSHVVAHQSHHQGQCKAQPGSHDWPAISAWERFNNSLEGDLIKPVPPGAVCHFGQVAYDEISCQAVKVAWGTYPFHAENPVSSSWNNDNNDTCIPDSQYPCTDAGYPQYVVNATTASKVKIAVDFAREHNIRLIVKGSGHDYLGRFVVLLQKKNRI